MVPSGYRYAEALTKHDSTNAASPFKAVYVGGAGVVAVVTPSGQVVNFTAVAGGLIPIAGIRVNSTNTTATLMVGLR